ncbi:threonylcarbamoyl-AMP synthase [Rhodoferax sp. 4810]|uniref:Threonylcarbamoyl-AMP synthase n=1 Tax=Thiospirillum jenense TaxID=1653858 RepID=A0A839HBS2_9GAMM|nr:L-threonylcarbamoyladenylate synthase [Thiospirillum jenense]MBB1076546.1 threonylcarbamoyl-AMP synthase [Rhodoferax jenense]MBB1124748.1 threonylcarbamoyl-AMP synthase [Thiospirillum jenense]
MAQYFEIHPDNPQPRLINRAADIVRNGGVIIYPTDTCYALGCQIGEKSAMERIRQIRRLDDKHPFTLICRDLSDISTYARIDNQDYRLLKSLTPGAYTFVYEATKQVPRRLLHPKRRAIGIRVPDTPIARALLGELGQPLLTTTLILPGDTQPLNDTYEMREQLAHCVDLIIDGGHCGNLPTTVIDMTGDMPQVLRIGKGDASLFTAALDA